MAVIAATGLMLSACESFEKDIRTSVASTQAIFTDMSVEKLVAATPTVTTPSSESAMRAKIAQTTAQGIMATQAPPVKIEEHIVTGDNKIIPVPASHPERDQKVAANSAPAPTCPDVRIVSDLNQVHQFNDGRQPDQQDSVSSIWMKDIKENCTIGSKNISIDMTLAFEGTIGPKGKSRNTDKPSFAYPYFVAITNNQGNIVAKEVFAVTLSYENGQTHETKVEKVRQVIPVTSNDMKNYKVLVGFQLSDDELAYNRSLPTDAFRMDAIQPASGSSGNANP
jgi:hypothetical protein